MEGSGSGGIRGSLIIDDQSASPPPPEALSISCTQLELSTITVEIFSLLNTIIDGFECCTTSPRAPLIFVLAFPDQRVKVLTESRADTSLVADVFELGDVSISIHVCGEGNAGTCDPEIESVRLGEVTVSVMPSTSSAFPYGLHTRDRSFRDVLDGARPMYPPASIPFFSNYYRSLFVSLTIRSITTIKQTNKLLN